jgi:hypothetical protein
MKKLVFALIAAVGLAGPAAAASWLYGGFSPEVQWGGGKGRQQGPGPQQGERRRDYPPQQQGQRGGGRNDGRERMTDDDRSALHRDLEKANRELYRRR